MPSAPFERPEPFKRFEPRRRLVGPWYVAWERRRDPDGLDGLRAELAPLVRELATMRAGVAQ